jgi:hypothetical protein
MYMYAPGLGFQVLHNRNDGLPPLNRVGRQLCFSNTFGGHHFFLENAVWSALET